MVARIVLLLDGVDRTDDLDNFKDFLPKIKRHQRYDGFSQTFAEKRLKFINGAAAAIRAKAAAYGAFAVSTLSVAIYDDATNIYTTVLNGTLDYKKRIEDLIDGSVSILFFPNQDDSNFLNRSNVTTNLHELKNFDGNDVAAFTTPGPGETYTLSLTKTEIDGLNEIETSNCEIMLPWEIFLRLGQKIIGKEDAVRSTLLQRTDGSIYQGTSDGRLAFVGFTNGGLIRGGNTTDYPIQMSLDDFFGYINAIEPICLFIDYENGEPFLRLEGVDYVYDSTNPPIMTISNPTSFKREANESRVFGKILSGNRIFEKASDTGVSGTNNYINSVHTTRSYVTGLDKISSRTYNVRTNAIGSSYLKEVVRNNTISGGQSDEMNREIFYQVVKRSGSDFVVDNDNTGTTGILNNSTQTNYLLTPGRTILNHLKMINGCVIQEYKRREIAEGGNFSGYNPIRFVEGDGNKSATSKIGSEAAYIAENADLSAGVEPIFLADDLKVRFGLTAKEFQQLITGLSRRIRIVNGNDTYEGYLEELTFLTENLVELRCKERNPDYVKN